MNENSNPTLVIEMSVFMYIARLHPFEEYFTLFPSTACQAIACHLQFYTLIELSIYILHLNYFFRLQQSRFFIRQIALATRK